ncbi:MAG: ribbon-helix-helix domain-containing protein [Ilumatobacteraceae bacterium]
MAQMVARLDDELAAAVDQLVACGAITSRSEAIRVGLQRLVDDHRRRLVGQRIVDGYEAQPQSESEVGWADESTIRMIGEQAW